jgi:transposase-like protein
LWQLRGEHPLWRNVEARTCKYLNNIVEQDHRTIKRRCASMMGFKSFYNASIALAGVELGSSDSKAPVLVRSRTASSPVNENHVGDGEGVKRRPRKTAVSS